MKSSDKDKLRAAFPQVVPGIEKVAQYFTPSVYPSKKVLLREGETAGNLYVIVRGCIRVYLIRHDGREITTQFFFEGQMVASLQSFFTGDPSKWYLETIEETEVFILKKGDFERLMAFDSARQGLISFLKTRLFHYQDLHASYVLDSPEKRYLKLLDEYPSIADRLPHYYIASFLGITPVSLSRIRSRLKKRSAINKG